MLHSASVIFLSLSVLAAVGVWGPFVRDGGFDAMDAVVARHPSTGIPGLQHYPEFDRGLMSIVAFNLSAVNSIAYCFMMQFLANVAVIPVILCTEDSSAAPGSWVRYSTIWGLLSQLGTSAVIYPLYAMSFIRQSSREPSQTRQPMSDMALILNMAMGYALPAAITLNVLHSSLNMQIWGILAFTVYPICMKLMARIIKVFTGFRKFPTRSRHQSIPTLRYAVAGGVALQGHLWYLGTELGIFKGHTPSLSAEKMDSEGGARLVLRFLQVDYAITFLAMLLLAWHELIYHRILPAWRALGGLIIGWILVGPGATLAAAWYLRSRFIMAPGKRKKRYGD
uniref:Terpene cyclase n=1 Tax=Pyrenophora dematioidea TaxID=139229 RepID=LAN5_PYRDE|nr:hypothetical protein [Pyrenophora dematioidea]